jgi:uncharacterized GH25 family protein
MTVTVVGPDGKPVAGAAVFLMKAYDADTTAVETKTDAQGRVSFAAPRAVFVAPGAPLGVGGGVFDGKKATAATVRLARAGSVAGRVVDAGGKPLAGAKVGPEYLTFGDAGADEGVVAFMPLPESVAERLRVMTGADGAFQIKEMPSRAGSVMVRLRDERFIAARMGLPLPEAERKATEALVAKPGAVLKGQVVDAATGKPAPGVLVHAQGVGIQDGGGNARSGADGTFALIGLPEGRFNVSVTDPRGAAVAKSLEGVKATPGRTTTLADLNMTPGGFVIGRLIDADTKQPIAVEAAVGVHGPHRPQSSAMIDRTEVKKDGTYRLRVPSGTSSVYLTQPPEGYVYDQKLIPVTVAEGGTQTVDFAVKQGLTVEGTLVDEAGKPVANTSLQASQGFAREVYATTDAQGRFTAKGLAPGEVRFSSGPFGDAFALTGNVTATLPTTAPVRLLMRKPDPAARLSGRVVDTQGLPVAGAKVEVMAVVWNGDSGRGAQLPPVETDADGRFTTGPIAAEGKVQSVKVTKPGYVFVSGGAVTQAKAGGPATIADFVLTRLGGVVKGSVEDAKGKPVAGARVLSLAGGGAGSEAVTDAAGRFTLTTLPEGKVEIIAGRDGIGVATVLVQTSGGGGGPSPILTLEPVSGATVTGGDGVERAAALAEEALRESANGTYYARSWLPLSFAAYAPERATVLAEKYRAGSAASVASAVLSEMTPSEDMTPEAVAAALAKISEIQDPYDRARVSLRAARALSATDLARARSLHQQARAAAEAMFRSASPWQRAFLAADFAALASRLGEPEQAKRDLAAALAATDAIEPNEQADGIRTAVAEALAERDAPDLAAQVIARIGAKEREQAYSRAISAAARRSPAAARALLERAEAEKAFEGGDGGGDYSRAQAQRHVAAGLAAREPDAALALAHKISERSERTKALTAIAGKLPKARAAAVYREALEGLAGQYSAAEIAARAGAEAMTLDPALGREMLAKAREYADERKRLTSDIGEGAAGLVSWAYYAGRVTPVASRLTLEREWAAALRDPDIGREPHRLLRIALAMAPADTERAVELARKIPAGNARYDAMRKLAQYLAAPPAIRKTIPLDRWAASDTWTPGTPTGW